VNKFGLHIRLIDQISNVAQKALRLQLPYFQTFLIDSSKRFIKLTSRDKEKFALVRNQFETLFLHASYWINCANPNPIADRLLERELFIAQNLGFNYLIIHPGSINKEQSREEALHVIAKRINRMLNKFPDITILLENIAHAKRSIGGDLEELRTIYDQIIIPERVGFCLDTTHAHAYGYDLIEKQDDFITYLEQILSLQNIKLIHLNDTIKPMGSRIDLHAIPGKGKIGKEKLLRFVQHPILKKIPIILELPRLDEEKERLILENMKNNKETYD